MQPGWSARCNPDWDIQALWEAVLMIIHKNLICVIPIHFINIQIALDLSFWNTPSLVPKHFWFLRKFSSNKTFSWIFLCTTESVNLYFSKNINCVEVYTLKAYFRVWNPRAIRIRIKNMVLQIFNMFEWAWKLPQNSIFLEYPT